MINQWTPPDLSVFDRIRLSRVAAKCDALKSRLEGHGFKIIKFQVFVSPDDLELLALLPRDIGGILATVRLEPGLAVGEVEVAALAR